MLTVSPALCFWSITSPQRGCYVGYWHRQCVVCNAGNVKWLLDSSGPLPGDQQGWAVCRPLIGRVILGGPLIGWYTDHTYDTLGRREQPTHVSRSQHWHHNTITSSHSDWGYLLRHLHSTFASQYKNKTKYFSRLCLSYEKVEDLVF